MIKNDHWITNTEAPTFNISNGLALISVINRHIRNKSTQRAQTMPRPKCQPKVIQDSDPDWSGCLPNLSEMLRIHYLVGIGRFTKFRTSRPVTTRTANKSWSTSAYGSPPEVIRF